MINDIDADTLGRSCECRYLKLKETVLGGLPSVPDSIRKRQIYEILVYIEKAEIDILLNEEATVRL